MASRANKTLTVVLLFAASQLSPRSARSQTAESPLTDYARAESLVRNHDWDRGLELLNHLLKTDPRNLKALNLAGIACAAKGDSQQADVYFERALKVDSRFLPALKNLSISEFNDHRYVIAEKHLSAIQEQLPNDPTVNLYLGRIAYERGDYGVAAKRLSVASQITAREPRLEALLIASFVRSNQKPQALALLNQTEPSAFDLPSQITIGLSLAEFDANEQAIPYLAAAFAEDPASYNAGYNLALVCLHAKQDATAIATLQQLIVRSHDSSEVENLLADAFAADGKSADALDTYRKAITLDPADEDNYVDLASLCLDLRSFGDSMNVIAAGLRILPASSRLIFLRGVVEASQDDFDLAEKDFEQAASLNPKHDFGTFGLGALYLERGNSAEALKVTRAQLRQRPNAPDLLYLLGAGLLSSGAAPGQPTYVEAQTSLERSVKIDPSLSLPHVSLGTIYLREQRYADAAAQFEAARAIDPNENSAYSHLAVAYRHMGQPDKAKEVLAALQTLLFQQRSGLRNPADLSRREDAK